MTLRAGAGLSGTAIPVTVSWTGADTGGSGIARYELARSLDGGSTRATPVNVASPAYPTTAASAGTVRFRVRAVDRAGNISGWALGVALAPALSQQTATGVAFTGTWGSAASTSYSGGSARYASARGAAVSYTFTGRGIAFVTTRAASRGAARVYVDGVLVATVDTWAATPGYRSVAWGRTWTTSGTHAVKIVVLGTVGRPRVDIDAFAILR